MTAGQVPGGAYSRPEGLPPRHVPVLLREVVEALAPQDNNLIIDATFGAGGYTEALLNAAPCRVIAFDRDITAIRAGQAMVDRFADRLRLIHAPFGDMTSALAQFPDFAAFDPTASGRDTVSDATIDGIVFDIGVSSMQIDQPERGFSFQTDGPLDMRMSASVDPLTGATVEAGESVADFLNRADETAIANVIYTYGEERRSRAIARAIVRARTEVPFSRTLQLADVVLRVFHGRKIDGRHPATRTFQALRIFINDELGELARGLAAAEALLKPGGRLAVVTFHSLEDRIVKRFLTARSGKEIRVSRHLPEQSIKSNLSSFQIVNSRPLTPSQGELDLNPRARSARLRVAVRTEAPAWPLDFDEIEVPQPDL